MIEEKETKKNWRNGPRENQKPRGESPRKGKQREPGAGKKAGETRRQRNEERQNGPDAWKWKRGTLPI